MSSDTKESILLLRKLYVWFRALSLSQPRAGMKQGRLPIWILKEQWDMTVGQEDQGTF